MQRDGRPWNAEVAGDLEQDRPSFAVRDELFLLVGEAVRAFASAARAPVSRWAELAQVLVEVLPLAGSTLPERRQDRHLAVLGIPAGAGRAGTPHRRERSPGEDPEMREESGTQASATHCTRSDRARKRRLSTAQARSPKDHQPGHGW